MKIDEIRRRIQEIENQLSDHDCKYGPESGCVCASYIQEQRILKYDLMRLVQKRKDWCHDHGVNASDTFTDEGGEYVEHPDGTRIYFPEELEL